MGFFSFIALLAAVWLLWNISRNTADALDKQTALQYELIALEKRLDERFEELVKTLKNSELPGAAQSLKSGQGADQSEAAIKTRNQQGDGAEQENKLVNINSAELSELIQLPKIGKATAQRIIDSRPFSEVDELRKVQGISEEIFAGLKARLVV